MRAWPGKFDGLRLRLSSGWYSIPWYLRAHECTLLINLLVAGIAELDQVVVLDWDALDDADKLQLTRALVLVAVPEGIEPDGEALQRVRATLGSVRLGLLQHEARSAWVDVAWQERDIKVPLLTWLKRWLRDPAHPFAKLGVADLPIDEIAKLTAEPVELLLGVEMVIDHRLRYRQQGMAREDWTRSVMHVAAGRLADRFMQIPAELRSRSLDLALFGGQASLVPALEDREAGMALAHVGLAWFGGNDLLLGPLLSLVHDSVVLRRLLELLPEDAWSQAGKQRARGALQVLLPPPRAALIAPEPEYSTWPAVEPIFPDIIDSHEAQDVLDTLPGILWSTNSEFDLPTRRKELLALPDWSQYPRKWQAAIETSLAMLEEIQSERLMELDFQRGRIYRFEAVDRAWADQSGEQDACAYFRWLGLTWLLGRAHHGHRLEMLANEVDRTLDLVDSEQELGVALCSLKGDIRARRSEYRCALDLWARADRAIYQVKSLGHYRLGIRRGSALLRLDEVVTAHELRELNEGVDWVQRFEDISEEDILSHGMLRELIYLTNALRSILQTGASDKVPWLVEALPDANRARITRIAVALEYGDWPHAITVAKLLERDTTTAEGIRAELLQAWIQASLGDLDRANATFDDILELAVERDDRLAQAFARRGFAAVAHIRNQTDSAIASLEAAAKIEHELGLPDADLLELELIGWRVLAGQLTLEDYNTKLAEFEGSGATPSLSFALLDSYLRFLASARAVVETTDSSILGAALHPFVDTFDKCVRLRDVSMRIRPACEVALELATRLESAGITAEAEQIREAMRQMTEGDPERLASE